MATRRARAVKAMLGGLIWLAMRVPTDVVLIGCNQSGVLPYAITLQLVDFVVISYMLFRLFQYRLRKPWKCPACDGWGRRMHTPGIGEDKIVQLSTCSACNGSGYIWEQITAGEGENL